MQVTTLPPDEQISEASNLIMDIWQNARQEANRILLETYHQIGQILYQLPEHYSAVKRVSLLTKINERTLYHAIKFYETYPETDQLPPEATSWTKVVKKYLYKKEDAINLLECPCCHTEFEI